MKKIIFILLIFLLIPSLSWAATYYVSSSLGADTNNGTAEGTPFANSPGLVDCANTCASTTLNPGDIVYFRSEDTWTKVASGDEVLKLAPGVSYYGDSWGSGTRAKIEISSGTLNNGIVGWEADHATTPQTFHGFEVDGNNVSLGDSAGGLWMGMYDQPSNMTGAKKTFSNCVVHDIGAGDNYTYGVMLRPWGTHTLSNVDVLNCTFYNTRSDLIAVYPIGTNNLDTVLIRGCEAYAGGLRNGGQGAAILIKNWSTNITGEFNYFHDTYQGVTIESTDDTNTAGSNIIVRYNIIKGISETPSILIQNGFVGTRTSEFYGNIIYGNTAIYGHGMHISSVTAGTGMSTKIYNNIFYNNVDYELWIDNSTITNTVEVKNNIFYAASGVLPLYDAGNEITDHSNNLYYRVGGGNLVTNGGSSYTAANIQAGYEATAQVTDPTFKADTLPTGFSGTYGTNMVPNTTYFAISSGNALNTGATLGSPYNGCINGAGLLTSITRPQGAGYDIGAYEYGATTLIGGTLSGGSLR